MEYIIAFLNTNAAIKAEQCLLEQKLSVGVMPLPSQIRAGCGICLRINQDEISAAVKTLSDNGNFEITLFSRTAENGKYSYIEENTTKWRAQDENS